MYRVVLTAQIENPVEWEKTFRTHGDLFRSQTVKVVHFSVSDSGEAVLYLELDDLDKYMEVMQSPATAEAMKHDGVRRETVKIFALDKELKL